jgi:hypothetical protein
MRQKIYIFNMMKNNCKGNFYFTLKESAIHSFIHVWSKSCSPKFGSDEVIRQLTAPKSHLSFIGRKRTIFFIYFYLSMTRIDKEEQQQVILLDTQPFSAHQSHCQDLELPPLKNRIFGTLKCYSEFVRYSCFLYLL